MRLSARTWTLSLAAALLLGGAWTATAAEGAARLKVGEKVPAVSGAGAATGQVRTVDYAKEGVRRGSNPYIGRLNNSRVRAALKATLDGFLSGMVLDEMLTGYTLDVRATRAEEINGQAIVTMTLQPTFSIDFVKVIMNLQ